MGWGLRSIRLEAEPDWARFWKGRGEEGGVSGSWTSGGWAAGTGLNSCVLESRVDTALKQLRQIREYEQRLKGLEQQVRSPGQAGGGWAGWDGRGSPSGAVMSYVLPRSSTVPMSWAGWPRP